MNYGPCTVIAFIMTLFVVASLSSCSNRAEESKEVMRRWYEDVWNRGELGLVDEIIHPEAKAMIDVGAIKQAIEERRVAFPDLRFFIQDMIVEKEKVVTRWSAHGTHQGALRGVAPTGRQMSTFGISIGVVQSGKLAGLWESWDALGSLVQLGIVPKDLNISASPLKETPKADAK